MTREEKFKIAADMRADGCTFKSIGAALGVSAAQASIIYTHQRKYVEFVAAREKMVSEALKNDILDLPVEALNIDRRCLYGIYHDCGHRTVRGLLKESQVDILAVPNLGQKSLNMIISALREIGVNHGNIFNEKTKTKKPTIRKRPVHQGRGGQKL